MSNLDKIILHDGREVKHGEVVTLPVDVISPNLYNPNEMDDEEFAMLADNVERIGFIDPITVVPEKDNTYTIVDGYHRFEQQRVSGAVNISCIIVDPEIFDEKTVMLQTVRLNKIKGSLNTEKFNALVDVLVNKHEVPFDDLADELGFVDEDEFNSLVEAGRKELPKEAHKEYDKAVKKVNDINALAKLIERLWIKYSNTVPANFFIIDYGNMRHLWVQMNSDYLAMTTDKFRDIFERGYKVSSVLQILLEKLEVDTFINEHEDILEKVDESEENLDSLLEP